MPSPVFTIKDVEAFERPVTLRLPFKFGVITLTSAPQLFLKVIIEDEQGNRAQGWTAELMVPKWFDKNKDLSHDDNINQLRRSIEYARAASLGRKGTAFDLHGQIQESVRKKCAAAKLNMLIASFGVAQIDKAVLDALCRMKGISFYQAVRENIVGMGNTAFLAGLKPLEKLHVRHTVGLIDPLTQTEIATPVNDGLPQSLDGIAKVYGHRYYKIKVNGDLDLDVKRLEGIAAVLDALPWEYKATLDGNEQYKSAGDFAQLLAEIEKSPRLEKLRKAILYIEQPVHRDNALAADMTELAKHFPVILDESDDSDDVFEKGKALGYTGISSKACKGLYRALHNAALADGWNKAGGGNKYFLSAEDLTTQAGLAVQQDLALIALLGLTHVERNGHHYVDGMTAGFAEAQAFAKAHPDLYRLENNKCRLTIKGGEVDIKSLDTTGFASGAVPEFTVQQAA